LLVFCQYISFSLLTDFFVIKADSNGKNSFQTHKHEISSLE
jgi:hypothetical protein